MKFIVQMKDPDTLHDAIADAVKDELDAENIKDPFEVEALAEVRKNKCARIASKWFKYSEYLAVEIDTTAETITVLPASRI